MTNEVWKIIPSLPSCAASSLGRIKVLPYTAPLPNGGERTYGGLPRFGDWDGDRYIWTHRRRSYKVARLVCEAFNGHATTDRNVCMHMDENARNNKPGNLMWGTQKLNLNFPGFLKHCQSRTGSDNPFSKGRRKQRALARLDFSASRASVYQT